MIEKLQEDLYTLETIAYDDLTDTEKGRKDILNILFNVEEYNPEYTKLKSYQ